MDSLAAGKLRHMVSLRKFVQTSTDGHGQPVGEWQHQDILRVSIEPVGPRDADVVNQLYHEASHIIRTRYRSTIARDNRLVYQGRTFHIGYVGNENESNRTVRLLCNEVIQ